MIQLCYQIIHYNLGRTYYKMISSISENINGINSKVKQSKAQYDLDRQTAKISAFSPGSVSKYEFLTGKDVLPGKDLVEKAATIKRFEYSPLGKELNKQTCVAEKQYRKFDNAFESNKNEEDKTKNKLVVNQI